LLRTEPQHGDRWRPKEGIWREIWQISRRSYETLALCLRREGMEPEFVRSEVARGRARALDTAAIPRFSWVRQGIDECEQNVNAFVPHFCSFRSFFPLRQVFGTSGGVWHRLTCAEAIIPSNRNHPELDSSVFRPFSESDRRKAQKLRSEPMIIGRHFKATGRLMLGFSTGFSTFSSCCLLI
jgi:hypothetical protein